ncbi:MAG: agmatine deiminase family protein [Candidatus Eremiobacteraeota bacterium]|nr:agmatine deiminase family protein [Candidatus Eremiobacteraeota bacterium]
MKRRMPAEWEEQSGILITWPHERTDWAPALELVEPVFLEIAATASQFEKVLITIPSRENLEEKLGDAGASLDNIYFFYMESNDTWARDHGPLTVFENGMPRLLDFGFNGWGLKFPACFDNMISRTLHRAGAFGNVALETVGLVLEGGSIESDGEGTLLTTSECLLSPNRNPHLTREELEDRLFRLLGAQRMLWIESGYLAGDDTDSHVDTLARFCPHDTIVHLSCEDEKDEHYEAMKSMEAGLREFRTPEGRPYRLVALPMPRPIIDEEGERLPATYANFLVINGAVLVPLYDDEQDGAALKILGGAFPGRCAVGINCRPLLAQHGSLHCVTMHLPEGVLPCAP